MRLNILGVVVQWTYPILIAKAEPYEKAIVIATLIVPGNSDATRPCCARSQIRSEPVRCAIVYRTIAIKNLWTPASCPRPPEMHGLQLAPEDCPQDSSLTPRAASKDLTGAASGRMSEGMADASFDALAVTRQLKAKGFDSD